MENKDNMPTGNAAEETKLQARKGSEEASEKVREKDARGRVPMGRIYRVLWWLVRGFCRLFFLLKITGEENLKQNHGGCIVVANHISYKDPVLLGVCMHQRLRFMAKKDLFKNPLFAWLIRSLGAFPVSHSTNDTASIRKAIRVIQQGEALMMFPEGTRSKDKGKMLPFEKGVGFIAQSAKAQVIPAYISPARLRGRYRVNIGQALDVSQLVSELPKKERIDAITHLLEEAVTSLKQEQEAVRR